MTGRSQPEVVHHRAFDPGHLVPVEVVHRVTSDVRDVDGANLIHQESGPRPGKVQLRPEHAVLLGVLAQCLLDPVPPTPDEITEGLAALIGSPAPGPAIPRTTGDG